MISESANPLQWPLGRPRTRSRSRSKFKLKNKSFAAVRDELLNELRLYGARNMVLSTNLKLRLDGWPMSGQAQPADTGVAAYFTDRKGRRICFACDKWATVEENVYSIAMTVNAIRGIGRWGMEEAVDAAFTGFQALPPPGMTVTEAVEFLSRNGSCGEGDVVDNPETFKLAYRRAAMRLHPDKGGSAEDFKRLEDAYRIINEAYHRL